jgi:hypothetical protein
MWDLQEGYSGLENVMKQIEIFQKLIEEQKYYEAHEILEEVWFPIRKTKTNCSLVLKGFINGAVSLELHKRDKHLQSKNVYQTYKKYTNKKRIETTTNKEFFLSLKNFMDETFEKKFQKLS